MTKEIPSVKKTALPAIFGRLGASKKVIRYSDKRTINLADVRDKSEQPIGAFLLGTILICAMSILIAKFGVIDPLARESAAESRYNAIHAETVKLENEAKRFDEVRLDYLTYTSAWMTEASEKNKAIVGVDRKEVLKLVDDIFAKHGNVYKIVIRTKVDKEGNSSDYMEVTMGTDTMKTASDALDAVRMSPLCQRADFCLAETNSERYDDNVRFTIKVYLQAASEAKKAEKSGKKAVKK